MGRKTPSALVLAGLSALAACAEATDAASNVMLDGDRAQATPRDASARKDGGQNTISANNSCAHAQVNVRRLIPTVQVVVDASGSMTEPMSGACATRWDCLRGALIGDQGLITELQGTVSFGLTLFGGQIAKIEDGKVTEVLNPMCPRILDVAPALDNREPIATRYDIARPGGGTPTAEALRFAIDALPSPREQLESPIGPQIILLVTDGDPNVCTDPVATQYEPTEAQALRAQQKGIQLFALTVADDQNRAHLQRMANLGAGLAANAMPGAPFFEPNDSTELSEVLRSIVGDAVGCNVELEGTVNAAHPGDECKGTVAINGAPLECDGTDGWRLDGKRTLVLQGEACERLKFDPSVILNADFPCDLVSLL